MALDGSEAIPHYCRTVVLGHAFALIIHPTKVILRISAALRAEGLPDIESYGQRGPEGSLVKWLWSDTNQRLTSLAAEIVGPSALIDGAGGDGTSWSYELLRARGNTIEGGTTEVLKNIVAERVLGLPRLKAAA